MWWFAIPCICPWGELPDWKGRTWAIGRCSALGRPRPQPYPPEVFFSLSYWRFAMRFSLAVSCCLLSTIKLSILIGVWERYLPHSRETSSITESPASSAVIGGGGGRFDWSWKIRRARLESTRSRSIFFSSTIRRDKEVVTKFYKHKILILQQVASRKAKKKVKNEILGYFDAKLRFAIIA